MHTTLRALAYGVAGFGLLTTLTAMAALHPHQQVYFNALADTRTPSALANRYDMDYWVLAQRQSLEYLLERYPDGDLRVFPTSHSALILPRNDRERISFAPPNEADFHLKQRVNRRNVGEPPAFHAIRAYDSGIAHIIDPAAADYRDYHSAAYDDIAANGTLLARSDFDIYIYDGAIYYLSANCAPPTPKTSDLWMFLHIFSADPDNPPQHKRTRGFVNHGFPFGTDAAFFDGKCIGRSLLPDDYPIARIRTGQDTTDRGVKAWRVDIGLAARAAAQAAYKRIAAGDYGNPAAQSNFDLYLRGNTLIYLKEPCAAGDFDERFFLHIIPADSAALPVDRREAGYANLDFRFVDHGADIGGKCVGLRELPGYAIERIRTGQFVSGEGAIWRAEFAADP